VQRTFYSLVAAGTALIACCYGFARFGYGLFVPVFTEQFRLSPTAIGVIGAGSYLGYCAAIVVALMFTDRVGVRRMAVAAGTVATAGIVIVAVAQSAAVLAAGVLIAGTSTGLASPPLATVLAQRMTAGAADRAQTVVNAGTGIGVVASGPIAFVLFDQWRIAWGAYAMITAAVTAWIALTLRNGRTLRAGRSAPTRRNRPGTAQLLAASFLTGLGSIGVWNFGRDLIGTGRAGGQEIATAAWIVLGAAGVAGALGGVAVQRIGFRPAWAVAMTAMSAATLLLALTADHVAGVMLAASVFGATYISLTGLLLLWSTWVYPEAVAFGVGMSFFAIAAGQALGAPLVGALIESCGYPTAFALLAALGGTSVVLRPASSHPIPRS
jgi:predicted MFS family arabinose efflux permease